MGCKDKQFLAEKVHKLLLAKLEKSVIIVGIDKLYFKALPFVSTLCTPA